MSVRVGTYNVNNLFERAAVLRVSGFSAQTAAVLADIQRLTELLARASYQGAVGQEIVSLLEKYQFHQQPPNPWFTINEVRNRLYSVKTDGSGVTLRAAGRASWLGWVVLRRETVNEVSTRNTGRVIQEITADVLCVVEVEDRLTLARFNQNILKPLNAAYAHNLLIDGNDDRGIDLGLLSRFTIRSVRSHIDDRFANDQGQPVLRFSRDCPEYEVILPSGRQLWMLCNHLKSKGFGAQADNDEKRRGQARRVRHLLQRFDLTKQFVVVAGDLNDTPTSQPLADLMATPNLFDVLASNLLQGPRWTYDGQDQIDYLLVSKALHDRLLAVGIERRGIFRQNDPRFEEVTSKATQASDHAAVWADFNI